MENNFQQNLNRMKQERKRNAQKAVFKGFLKFIAFVLIVVAIGSIFTTDNYSNGDRVGYITQFSRTGRIVKTWEGHLNATQTGMNSSIPFDFSIDKDDERQDVIKTIDSAMEYGWKVKLTYHEVYGRNWWQNRGETDYFVTNCEVLNRNVK